MAYNSSADKTQFDAYKSRLGADAPKNFEAFQKLKYDDADAYAQLVDFYRYKGKVEEATFDDFALCQKVKSTGVSGSIRIPPLQTQRVYILEDKASKRDPAHIMRRMFERRITSEEIQSYVDNALFSVTQFKGTRRVFYSEEGVTVLTRTDDYEDIEWIAKTAWNKRDFDEISENAIREVLQNGK